MTYARKLFSYLGDVQTFSGRAISQMQLNNVDALILRSVTKVNETLLAGTSVKFVGTATSGTDHIDDLWLKKAGIEFSSAKGCNAIAVVEYVFSALLMLAERDGFLLKNRTIGIIGVGNIGRCLQERCEEFGVKTLLCDPPRSDQEEGDFHSIYEIIEQADILTFHTPLIKEGPYKTLHLVNEELINRLKPGCILINTCRGSVINNKALLTCLEKGQDLHVVLDVWESEPNLNISLLQKVDIGTAHIAGHTLEGKARSAVKLFESYSNFIGKPKKIKVKTLLPSTQFHNVNLYGPLDDIALRRLANLVYNIKYDHKMLKKIAEIPGEFDKFRENYFDRREWSSIYVLCNVADTASRLRKLGFQAICHSK